MRMIFSIKNLNCISKKLILEKFLSIFCTKFSNYSLFIVTTLCFTILSFNSGFSQNNKQNYNFGINAGYMFFDKNLSFTNSPSIEINGAYNMIPQLQLDFSFSYSPAVQEIKMAASNLKTEFSVYSYLLSIKLYKTFPEFFQIAPFVQFGAGGISFSPQSSSILMDAGGGQKVAIKLSTDHKLALKFGGGLFLPVYNNVNLTFEIQSYLYRVRLSGQTTKKYGTGINNYFGFGVSFFNTIK